MPANDGLNDENLVDLKLRMQEVLNLFPLAIEQIDRVREESSTIDLREGAITRDSSPALAKTLQLLSEQAMILAQLSERIVNQ